MCCTSGKYGVTDAHAARAQFTLASMNDKGAPCVEKLVCTDTPGGETVHTIARRAYTSILYQTVMSL
jgi:hypothetical protein